MWVLAYNALDRSCALTERHKLRLGACSIRLSTERSLAQQLYSNANCRESASVVTADPQSAKFPTTLDQGFFLFQLSSEWIQKGNRISENIPNPLFLCETALCVIAIYMSDL